MAGRFVFQQLIASGMSRPTSRLACARASASSRAAAPVMLTPRASEDGIRTLTRFFHNAAAVRPGNNVVPSITNHGSIRGYCRVPPKVRRLKARMPPEAASSNQLKLVEEPWHSRLVDWVSEKYNGIHPVHKLLIKLAVWVYCMTAGIIYSWPEDDSTSRIPSQSRLHCSGCNCRSRVPSQSLHCSGCNSK